jgi:hypothetical protein
LINDIATHFHILFILQKKALRIINFSKFDAHSTPIFKSLKIIKLPVHDIFTLHAITFMHNYYHEEPIFNNLFTPVKDLHTYNMRLASRQSYFFAKIKN